MPYIKINQPNQTYLGTTIEIDGKRINHVKNIDYRVGVDEGAQINLEVVGSTEIDMDAEYVTVDISPTNVQEAIAILRWEMAKDNPRCEHLGLKNELREAFIDSIESVLNEDNDFGAACIFYCNATDGSSFDKHRLAEKILDRLLGDEEQ